VNFGIRQRTAQLIGRTASERKEVFAKIGKFIKRRNDLFHDHYDVNAYAQGRFVTSVEVDDWSEILRLAILRQTVLYLRGYTDKRDYLMEALDAAALDPELGETLRSLSEPEDAISERFREITSASQR
jgi:hypothetical protein